MSLFVSWNKREDENGLIILCLDPAFIIVYDMTIINLLGDFHAKNAMCGDY